MANKLSTIDEGIRVAAYHQQQLKDLESKVNTSSSTLDSDIHSTESLLASLNISLPKKETKAYQSSESLIYNKDKSWSELVGEANQNTTGTLRFEDMLTKEEIESVLGKHRKIEHDLSWFSSLDRYDVALSVFAGVVAGVIDIFLVKVPKHPSFLGSAPSDGGWLSNFVKDKFGDLLPQDKIKELEGLYKVSYDPSTSRNLGAKVEGLGPRTHRYQSLGHDPLLGFIFGVKDILYGEFSAIDKFGNFIHQTVGSPSLGASMFTALADAFVTQFGHLQSDVATPSGLPAPLMPLLMFIQKGSFGDKGYSLGELSRQMYRSGYDFRHFTASSIPVMVTELILRLGYSIKRLYQGHSIRDSLPLASSLTLRRQLLIAHSTALLINTGKVAVTQNPLGFSWAQTLATLRYVMPELYFLLHGKEKLRKSKVEELIMNNYNDLLHLTEEQK